MIEHVRKYALWGIPVFPVHWPQEGGARCSCKEAERCSNIGKHPMTRNGVLDATTDLGLLEPVWDRYPNANIGLATGFAMDVLDLDNDDEAIKALQDEIGLFAEDDPPIVQTGRGHHVWYRPIGSTNRAGILPGVDWRGKGGYVLAPPSLHANGNWYEMHGGPFDLMPAPPPKLVDLVLRQGDHARPERPQRIAVPPRDASIAEMLDYDEPGAEGPIKRMREAVEGERNHVLFWAACCLHAESLTDQLDRLAAAALAAGLDMDEIEQTINSAEKRVTDAMDAA